ncbi:MAG TPA: hypothetical protein PK024_10485 [Methanospirillum sp.]|uniref:hypothetical protein n=1 Tax=Methanospirillum sp. TaxID=45200 RepID=UPI002D147D70|nr:hypothetical protein [Methanospirillum sp.]HOJ97247.1 hypothetical protein [Methanospirillum sp.]HOL40746.1 hypothetical protein [Methanospirillum sp.]HPP77842.1 hypothetical protein [Methanospirillum sp.]
MKCIIVSGVVILTLFSILSFSVYADILVPPSFIAGEPVVIEGTTNFNTDNSIHIDIWPASFGPKAKYEPSMSGGGSGVVPVKRGNNSEYIWNGTFDSQGWSPDTYMVRAEVIGKGYVETAVFDLVTDQPAGQIPTGPITPAPAVNQTEAVPDVTPVPTKESETEIIIQTTPMQTQKSSLNGITIVLSLCILMGCAFIAGSRR